MSAAPKHPLGISPEAWQGPLPTGPHYGSCGQRCPDCLRVVNVAGDWADWDRVHGAVCPVSQMQLPLTLTHGEAT